MEVDRDARVARERIGTEAAVRLELAGRHVDFELAEIDTAVALGVRGVDGACGRDFTGRRLSGSIQAKIYSHGEVAHVTAGPCCVRGSIHYRADAEALEGRQADHVENGVERDVLELCRDFAVDRNGDVLRRGRLAACDCMRGLDGGLAGHQRQPRIL